MNKIPSNSNTIFPIIPPTQDQPKKKETFELPGLFAKHTAESFETKSDKKIYATQNEDLINLLPHGIFINIFRKFRYNELQTISIVCKAWNTSISTLANQRYESAIKFLNYLIAWLDQSTYSQQITQLESIKSRPTIIIQSINHISKFYKLIEEILEILKTVSIVDLDILEKNIENENRPLLFMNIFALARTFQKIDSAPQDNKGNIFELRSTISSKLIFNKLFDKAIQRSLLLPGTDADMMLGLISDFLRRDGRWSKARDVLEKISDGDTKEFFYKDYYDNRRKMKNHREIMNEILDEKIKYSLTKMNFKKSEKQYSQDFFDKCLEMLNEIKTKEYKNNLLMKMAQKSFEYNLSANFESAIEKITDSETQEEVILYCAKSPKAFGKVLDFAKRMQKERLIETAWLGSCFNHCQGKSMESMILAESAAENIRSLDILHKAFSEIFSGYLSLGKKVKILEFYKKSYGFSNSNHQYDDETLLEQIKKSCLIKTDFT